MTYGQFRGTPWAGRILPLAPSLLSEPQEHEVPEKIKGTQQLGG
jgi:hypothetical protein